MIVTNSKKSWPALGDRSMTAPKTAAERQRARTERLAREGLKPVKVIVPAAREGEIKAVAEKMVAESQAARSKS